MVVCENGTFRETQPSNVEPVSIINAAVLSASDLPDVEFVVRDLFPVGLAILVAPPKTGKSFLSMELALAVSSGGSFLGFQTTQGGALYLALEDSPNRLKKRMEMLLEEKTTPQELNFATQINNLSSGLLEQLDLYITQHPNNRLIIIDTLAFVRGEHQRGESAYKTDYADLSKIKKFADAHKQCVLVIHHTRKMTNPSDPFDQISGTNGIAGAVDVMAVIAKEKRKDSRAVLHVTGRDIEPGEYAIEMKSGKWKMVGDAEEIAEKLYDTEFKKKPLVKTIQKLVSVSPNKTWQGSARELIRSGQQYGFWISTSERSMSKELKTIAKDLQDRCLIDYSLRSNGSGGAKHLFKMQEIPFSIH